jgi:hypothetical protein
VRRQASKHSVAFAKFGGTFFFDDCHFTVINRQFAGGCVKICGHTSLLMNLASKANGKDMQSTRLAISIATGALMLAL